jgi:hypothetical protein
VVVPAFRDGPGKQIPSVTLEHIRESVVGAGLATDDGIDAIIAELNGFAENHRTIMSLPRIFQVWGRRPS